ncbi:hypothetical protein PINS_up012099 [Pythium insidiosum]|nr:hypothetical protein PINS_up012099 [Pythium insidiosum]
MAVREAAQGLLAEPALTSVETLVPRTNVVVWGHDAIKKASTTSSDVLRCELTLSKPIDRTMETSAPMEILDVKIDRAAMYRQRGNDLFKQEKWRDAMRSYRRVLRWLACPDDCKYDVEETIRVHELAVPCSMNIAMCMWKLSDWNACVQQCGRVLEILPKHTKALYRRSQALLQTKAFAEALQDLEKAIELEPDNKLFRSSLDRARYQSAQHQSKTKKAFAAAFD